MTRPIDDQPEGPAAPIRTDRVVRLSPWVRRLTQPNPGPFTGPGTNTYLVGRSRLVVLEPGEDRDDGHLERIVAAVGDLPVLAVIPSHGHSDHWTLAPPLARRLGAPIRVLGAPPALPVDLPLADGETIELGEGRLEVVRTPGHTPDHACFVLRDEGALFPGDHVMGWSTSIIAPPEGDLRAYLASLDRLLALPALRVAYPAHGPAILDPYARIRELRAHREERTRQTLAALARGPSPIRPLVARIYAGLDPSLHPAAAQSLAAHLLALEAEGRVTRGGPPAAGWEDIVWSLAPEPAAGTRRPTASGDG